MSVSTEKIQHYRNQLRIIGEFLIFQSEHSDGYIRGLIYNRYSSDFEKALRELIKSAEH